jgi:nicotinamidase-related amidase
LKRFNPNTALLVVDMQAGFDDPAWGARNNRAVETNVAALIAAWRAASAPVVHVHHNSPGGDGRLRAGTAGATPKPEALPTGGEAVYSKSVNSAFIGTSLEADLHKRGVTGLVIVGLTTNHCISTTARMAGNLGFETFVVSDATAAFDRPALDGSRRAAEEVHAAALSDLRDEFASIVETQAAIAALAPCSAAEAIFVGRGGGQTPAGDGPPSAAAERRRVIFEEMVRRLAQPGLNATRLAAALGVTPRYLHRLLEPTGRSFSQHLLDRRLDLVAQRLADPQTWQAHIADLAYGAGFSDLSHFNRNFRRRFNVTPKAWRRLRASDAR